MGRGDSRSRSRRRSRTRSRGRGGHGKGGGGDKGYGESVIGQSIMLKNLNYRTNSDTLRAEFDKFGGIKDVYVPLDFYTRQPKGFGFVEYYNVDDATDAVREMDGRNVDGNVITVSIAQNRRRSPGAFRYEAQLHRRRSTPPRRRGGAYSRSRSRRRASSRSRSRRRRSRSRSRY